jgi:ABC-type branched-subunit amino acid transport system substrate-binding protein
VQSEQSARGGYRTPPNGHIMLAYDAVTVLLTAVEDYRDKHNGRLPNRTQISDELRNLPGCPGVAGVVNFGDTGGAPAPAGRDPVDKLVVVQQVARDGAGVVSRFVTADGAL